MAEYIERTEKLMLAMNAGARAIENTKRYHGAVYTKDVLSDNPQKIPYLLAAKVLREVSDTPAADVSPVVRGKWVHITRYNDGERMIATCSRCRDRGEVRSIRTEFGIWEIDSPHCPNCGVKMNGGNI